MSDPKYLVEGRFLDQDEPGVVVSIPMVLNSVITDLHCRTVHNKPLLALDQVRASFEGIMSGLENLRQACAHYQIPEIDQALKELGINPDFKE